MESAATDHFVGDESKPTFHLIEPRTAGRCEVEVDAAAFRRFEPTLDVGALGSTVVVENGMVVEFRGHFLFHLIEESDELFAMLVWQTTADDLAIGILKAASRVAVPCSL